MSRQTEILISEDSSPSNPVERAALLEAELAETRRERDQLLATVEILQAVSEAIHFGDILQTITRKLGETFGLDRCSIFLTGDSEEVRVVASYEDPSVRNLVVDVRRYPELRRALESGQTVFIADALADPMLEAVRHTLDLRKVRSIVVVPIRWRGAVIGAIFLRTERDGSVFSESDVRFCQAVAALTASALHNSHRFEAARSAKPASSGAPRRGELQRVALVAFLKRLLDRYTQTDDQVLSEALLPSTSEEELQRLVSVALHVIEEEAQT
jgi:GAF domain-containing protein